MPKPLIVDSGAAASVIPIDWFETYFLQETPETRSGCTRTAANEKPIKNYGQRTLKAATPGGEFTELAMHVCDVNRALGSVSSICRSGNRVVFDDDGSYIENKNTGGMTWLRQEGVYVLDLEIAPVGYRPERDFTRRGP